MLLILSAGGAVLADVSGISSSIRVAIIFWFMLVCPGMAFVRLLHLDSLIVELTLAISLSITLGTLVAEAMVLARRWSPQAGLVVLAAMTIGGAMLQIRTSAASRET